MNLWDTVGTERFQSLNRQYYNDSAAAIFVYDVTDENSFESLQKWVDRVEEHCPKQTIKILVGNKIDLYEKHVVSAAKAQKFAIENDFAM